jgi:hypothetical protein
MRIRPKLAHNHNTPFCLPPWFCPSQLLDTSPKPLLPHILDLLDLLDLLDSDCDCYLR